ncbi:MAG: DUF3499 family protein [Acidimicrobiales bacterium]
MTPAVCARPGCQGPTAAWLTYDYAARRVWLDDAPGAAGGDHWALCAAHAGRLRVPRGWAQVDRRVGPRSSGEPMVV